MLSDGKTYDAVLMNFIIIGEAANRLSAELRSTLVEVDWRAMVGFRNIVAHDYFGVDINVVWAAVKIHLPQLREDIRKHLELG